MGPLESELLHPGTRAREEALYHTHEHARLKGLSEHGKAAPHDSLEIPLNVRRSE